MEPRVTAEGRNVIPSHERGDSTSVCAGLCYVDGRPPAGDDLLTRMSKDDESSRRRAVITNIKHVRGNISNNTEGPNV